VSVLRQLYGDASLVDSLVPTMAFPSRPIRGAHEKSVRRHLDCHAKLIDRSIASLAGPTRSIGRDLQVSVWRDLHGFAVLAELPITPIAFPAIAGGVQIGICGQLDDGAGLLDLPITSIAFPTASVGRIRWICMCRHLDGRAGPFDLSIPSIAFPSTPIALRECILGHPDGSALGEHGAGGGCEKRQENQGVNGYGAWSSRSPHGSFLLVDAEHRTDVAAGRINQGARADLDFDMNARLISIVRKRLFSRLPPSLPRS
jgi:hypothetical protein